MVQRMFVISFDNTQNRRALDNHWSDWRKLSGLVGAGEIAYAILTFGTDVAGGLLLLVRRPSFSSTSERRVTSATRVGAEMLRLRDKIVSEFPKGYVIGATIQPTEVCKFTSLPQFWSNTWVAQQLSRTTTSSNCTLRNGH